MRIAKKKTKKIPNGSQLEFFSNFLETKARIKILYGGAGSGKSYAIAQHICEKFIQPGNLKMMVIRKTLPSLRITAYPLILKILSDWGIPYQHLKAERKVSFGSNVIYFNGLDDPEKVKSFEADIFWVEEATDCNREDILQLTLRLNRTDSSNAELIMSFNPVDSYHFLITDFVQGNRPDVIVHHSTYKDNKFLSPEFIQTLKDLQQIDENHYRVYTLGLAGVLKNVIYSNYAIEDDNQWACIERPPEVYGLDFGYNVPSALSAHWFYDGEPYSKEIIYRDKLTNTDLIREMDRLHVSKTAPIYCDAAEPARIEELKRAGFNAKEADKSVKDGIDFLKSKRWHVSSESSNLIKELRNYKYQEKNGQVIDEPVKFMDHLLDSSRYSLYTHYKNLASNNSSRFLVSKIGKVKT